MSVFEVSLFGGGLVYGIGFAFVLVLIYLRVGFVGNECFF